MHLADPWSRGPSGHPEPPRRYRDGDRRNASWTIRAPGKIYTRGKARDVSAARAELLRRVRRTSTPVLARSAPASPGRAGTRPSVSVATGTDEHESRCLATPSK